MTAPVPRRGDEPLLSIRDLVIDFTAPDGSVVRGLEGVSLDVYQNEVLCLVGESGSGKTLTMLAVMGLLPPEAQIVAGQILLRGRDLVPMSDSQLEKIRGRDMAMVFQDPMTSLNPIMTVGAQIAEVIRIHRRDLSRRQVRERVIELLRQVHVPNPAARVGAYPHELSGGMRQRVMIAMSVAHNPSLLIADEPTTALDVTIQAQVLRLIADIRKAEGMAMVFITHDLGVVADIADRVAVMYAGRLVELGGVTDIFRAPAHPYTSGLLSSLLRIGERAERAYSIPGQPASIADRPSGCAFNPRCEASHDPRLCSTASPALQALGQSHAVACHFPLEGSRLAAVGSGGGR